MLPGGADDRAAWVRSAARRLAQAGFEEARADAEILWCRASGETRAELATRAGEAVPAAAHARAEDWLRRFAAGEPLAYLEGNTGFFGLELLCDPRALIPRADSEAVVELALRFLEVRRPARVLDLGTGSACLLLALLHQSTQWEGVGVDSSEAALGLAAQNARRLALEQRASFHHGDWFHGLRGRFALILSNPPYVVPGEELGRGVAEHEPHAALFTPAEDPMHAYRRILADAASFLAPGGCLVFEVGQGRADELLALAARGGWLACGRLRDLGGIERAVALRCAAQSAPCA